MGGRAAPPQAANPPLRVPARPSPSPEEPLMGGNPNGRWNFGKSFIVFLKLITEWIFGGQLNFDINQQLSNMQKWEKDFALKSEYWQALATLYEAVPLFQQALSCYEKAYSLDKRPRFLLAQANMQERLKKPEKAKLLRNAVLHKLSEDSLL